jgi:hypothetical protein
MSDDSYSAAELRKRNLKGGSLADDQLSAAQIRARHGISGNSANWATKDDPQSSPLSAVAIAAVALLLLAAVAFVMLRGKP